MPDVTKNNTTDEIGNKETSPVEITPFQLAGNYQGQAETDNIDQQNIDGGKAYGNEKRIIEWWRIKQGFKISQSYKINLRTYTCPISHRVIQTEKERNDNNHDECEDARRDKKYIGCSALFHRILPLSPNN